MEGEKEELKKKLNRLFERQDGLNTSIAAAITSAQAAKAKKDVIAAEIQKKKEARGKTTEQARAISASLERIYEQAEKIDATGPSSRIRKELENLEWKFQTHAGSYAEEMRMWRGMGRLDAMLKKAVEKDGLAKQRNEKLEKLRSLRSQHDKLHAEVIALSKDWELNNAEAKKFFEQASELRKTRESLKEEISAAKAKLDAECSSERAEREKQRAERTRADKSRSEAEEAILRKKAEEVREKLRSGKKLTGDDLFIMQKAGIEP